MVLIYTHVWISTFHHYLLVGAEVRIVNPSGVLFSVGSYLCLFHVSVCDAIHLQLQWLMLIYGLY